ncbi:MAG: NYN domain-containing protein [Anaerolineae bacterium]|nr:NYN domain-containing protein [Anaerolineae bacterium]
MPLLVDGHNVIGRSPHLSLSDRDDEAKLIAQLRLFVARTGKRLTVVFDPSPMGNPPALWGDDQSAQGNLEIIYAASGRTADQVLRERIASAKDKQGLILVTSDAAIVEFARRCGLKQIRPAEWLVRALRQVAQPPRPDDKPARTADLDEWLKLFPEPPQPAVQPKPPKPDPAAIKRQRRLEQLRRQVERQRRLLGPGE